MFFSIFLMVYYYGGMCYGCLLYRLLCVYITYYICLYRYWLTVKPYVVYILRLCVFMPLLFWCFFVLFFLHFRRIFTGGIFYCFVILLYLLGFTAFYCLCCLCLQVFTVFIQFFFLLLLNFRQKYIFLHKTY